MTRWSLAQSHSLRARDTGPIHRSVDTITRDNRTRSNVRDVSTATSIGYYMIAICFSKLILSLTTRWPASNKSDPGQPWSAAAILQWASFQRPHGDVHIYIVFQRKHSTYAIIAALHFDLQGITDLSQEKKYFVTHISNALTSQNQVCTSTAVIHTCEATSVFTSSPDLMNTWIKCKKSPYSHQRHLLPSRLL